MNIVITKSNKVDTEDIFRVGNLVVDGNSVVLVTDKSGMPSNVRENKDYFCGILISVSKFNGVRYTFLKKDFKQFHGEIKITI